MAPGREHKIVVIEDAASSHRFLNKGRRLDRSALRAVFFRFPMPKNWARAAIVGGDDLWRNDAERAEKKLRLLGRRIQAKVLSPGKSAAISGLRCCRPRWYPVDEIGAAVARGFEHHSDGAMSAGRLLAGLRRTSR